MASLPPAVDVAPLYYVAFKAIGGLLTNISAAAGF
jgi:hypothetical protein